MILLWGLPGDDPIAWVHEALSTAGEEVAFLDQRRVLETEIELTVGDAVRGALRLGDQQIDLAEIGAVYLRPYDSRRIIERRHGCDGESLEAGHAVSVEDVLVSWTEIAPALVVSRSSDMAANNSKPYQAALIRAHGFDVPETLVTTEPEAAREFAARHGEVIYKSVSSVRSVVRRLDGTDRERLADVCWCPTQFQQYLPGCDHRVHVVGNEILATRIETEADDYRYAGEPQKARLTACELPPDCAARCRALARALRLPVAGIDLRLTPAGRWYCFEVNPSPGYSYFQQATGQRIDLAIARLLAEGDRAYQASRQAGIRRQPHGSLGVRAASS